MRSAKASMMMSVVTLTLIASPYATAQDPGWYIGANLGQSRANVDRGEIASDLLGGGLTATSIDRDERDFGYKLFGGYNFNKYFALEGGYFDLGRFKFSATTVPPGTLDGKTKMKGLNLDAVGTLPLTEKLSALGRVGVIRARAKDTFTGTGAVTVLDTNPRKYDTNVKFGLGVQYAFNPAVAMRLEAERYRIDDAIGRRGDIDLYSLGVVYRFGQHTPSPTQTETPTPVPVTSAPPSPAPVLEEAPVLVVVPVPAKTQEYCTILDIQFEINATDMQREEKEKLGVLGTFLTKYPETTAEIEGHTDNVGSAENNMTLSQQRAESVVNYLVNDLKIAPSRLTAVGYGATRPLADNSTEEGKRQNRRINAVVACVTDIEGLSVAPARITMAQVIEFDQNKAEVKPQYGKDLCKVGDYLKAHPSVTATVEGHTGNLQATPAVAMEISRLRAQNVVDYLVNSCGVERSRLSTEGFGKTRRFAYNTSAEGEQENRRVNIVFNYPKAP